MSDQTLHDARDRFVEPGKQHRTGIGETEANDLEAARAQAPVGHGAGVVGDLCRERRNITGRG